MVCAYSLFGFRVLSNLPLPGLEPVLPPYDRPDVSIHLGLTPDASGKMEEGVEDLIYVSAYRDESGEPALKIWSVAQGALLRLQYADGTQFWLDRLGKTVWSVWPASLSLEDTATYLLGPVIGILLRVRGLACLHASAVALGDRAAAFVGPPGAGKSTTAAAFAQRGHAVLSDDIVALVERDGASYAMPAYPYVSLWPKSVTMLYGPEKTLPSFSTNYNKQMLSLGQNNLRFQGQSLRLGAIFLLGERRSDTAAPLLESISPRESLASLVPNSYAARFLNKEMRAREFSYLGRMLATVPVWRICPHTDAARIDRLCDLVQRACASSWVSAPPAPQSA